MLSDSKPASSMALGTTSVNLWPMAEAVLIHFHSQNGEESEEEWPSIDAFINWAAAEGLTGSWRAFEEDEDGDFLAIAKGSIP